jgi:cytochrome c556
MRRPLATAAAALALMIAAGASARSARETAPTPEELAKAREAAMIMSVATLARVRAALSGESVKPAVFPARGLAQWAESIPAMFPASTASLTGTRARPEIWSDRAGFEARAAAFTSATRAMVVAAQADDRAALTVAVERTAESCKACHDAYQAPAPDKPAG